MAKKISKWKKFKRFLKRNMTPTWARHFSYQVFALLTSVAMIVGVADYAVTKSYDERKLSFMDDFTITAHTGAYDTEMNTLEAVKAAIKNNAEIIELDIRQRPDKTLVMSHDIVVTNNDGAPLEDALALIKDTPDMQINFDIKETRVLNSLHALLVDYNLLDRSFLTGIEVINVKAVKDSNCANMDYYLNYKPSKFKAFSDDYRQKLLSFWKIRAQSALTVTINLPVLSFQIFFIKRDINFLFGLLIPSVTQKKCLSLSLIILRLKTPK